MTIKLTLPEYENVKAHNNTITTENKYKSYCKNHCLIKKKDKKQTKQHVDNVEN